ncbi:nuclear transport factor 2 family protein [Yinghuangia sp. ASG 101]|uniref:nuclear transport factor 2 family protein n=1 Tax=Yinghuangia sp. ASG 101 TaxID=2896848 RepID=UPI001E2C4026|nr:nuclear transport factor 2 family protein [Yinghuangia sp. ASG 101]UGQ12559.1 nuclear transport factor 2 family protein [Yinghuangia sp. ASG 101]
MSVTTGADDTHAYIAITRLQGAYGDISVRRAWAEELAPLCARQATFTYDFGAAGTVELRGADQLGAFGAKALERFSFYQYIPVNTAVVVDDERTAHGRFYVLEAGQDRATGEWTEFHGVYHDDYVVEDGAWRFAGRQYRTLARRVGAHTVEVFSGAVA